MNKDLIYKFALQSDLLDDFKINKKSIVCALLNSNRTANYDTIKLEKYAELIVRECAKVMDKDVDHSYNSRGHMLKKHFGVNDET